MPDYQNAISECLHAVRIHRDLLFGSHNVHSIGVGHRVAGGETTQEPCVTVFVHHKLPQTEELLSRSFVPKRLPVGAERQVRTDIVESLPCVPQLNTARIRPARPGTSIGEISITAGTFGAVVVDAQSPNERMILSNNHVLAASNAAPLGSPIVQPGPIDGGDDPNNIIASLSRAVPLSTGHDNLVDAAIARPGNPSLISNDPLNSVPAPSTDKPAYGLHLGGNGTTQSIASPIDTVLTLLDVDLPSAHATATPTLGIALQKTGRTTEKTTGMITHIGVTAVINYAGLGNVTLVNQFYTTLMTQPGDSGSLMIAK